MKTSDTHPVTIDLFGDVLQTSRILRMERTNLFGNGIVVLTNYLINIYYFSPSGDKKLCWKHYRHPGDFSLSCTILDTRKGSEACSISGVLIVLIYLIILRVTGSLILAIQSRGDHFLSRRCG